MLPNFEVIGDPEPSDAEIAALARLLLTMVEVEQTETVPEPERECA